MDTPTTIQTQYMVCTKLRLERGESGFVTMEYNGEHYEKIVFCRAMPLTAPDEYISVCDIELNEIGIIRNLSDLDDDSRAIAQSELERRYYCPSINAVKWLREKLGYVYMCVSYKGGEKIFAVKDVSKSIVRIKSMALIFDVDGNRYRIDELAKLDSKSLKLLAPYIY